MAFSAKALVRQGTAAPVGTAAGATRTEQVSHFIYATEDAAATVEVAGYFNNGRAIINKGDVIHASMVFATTPVTKQYVVTAAPKTTGNVTIALQTTTAG
jgi:hypothetical protein